MSQESATLTMLPAPGGSPSLETAATAFLKRDLAPGSRRVYSLTLDRLLAHLGPATPVGDVTAQQLGQALQVAYPTASPASWNRQVATVRSFLSFCERQSWIADASAVSKPLERRRVPEDHSRSLDAGDLQALFARTDIPVRERCLWRLLYETAARANEILVLDIEDLDLAKRQARITSKGGDIDVVHWQTGSARLLPKVIAGRKSGPLFLAERPPAASRVPAIADLDPTSGLARLSYRRAAELFNTASGATLHQLRHSALTHLAEGGVDTVMLMAKSRHSSLRSLQRYARPGTEAVAKMTAENDPARRR